MNLPRTIQVLCARNTTVFSDEGWWFLAIGKSFFFYSLLGTPAGKTREKHMTTNQSKPGKQISEQQT